MGHRKASLVLENVSSVGFETNRDRFVLQFKNGIKNTSLYLGVNVISSYC